MKYYDKWKLYKQHNIPYEEELLNLAEKEILNRLKEVREEKETLAAMPHRDQMELEI